jgi:hypothetical protein
MADHQLLFPGFQPSREPLKLEYGPCTRAGERFVDDWGCVWETTDDGIVGTVTGHPLADWDAFDTYTPPDPSKQSGLGPIDWNAVETHVRGAKERGELTWGSLRHGHTFLGLCDIRGYEAVIYDMTDDDPRLHRLLEMLEAFNMYQVRKYVEFGVDVMGYPEDLGMQVGPMLSPAHLDRYLKPVYQRLMAPAREAGIMVHMHSDGDIRDLVDGLIEGGVEIVNLQDLVNGIDWIRERLAGKVAIDLDVDRQRITRFGTPEQIDALIREEVGKLGSPEGGLFFTFGLYPGTPLKNVAALMDAFERYMGYYS